MRAYARDVQGVSSDSQSLRNFTRGKETSVKRVACSALSKTSRTGKQEKLPFFFFFFFLNALTARKIVLFSGENSLSRRVRTF